MNARLSSWGIGTALRCAMGIKLGRFCQYPPRPPLFLAAQDDSDNCALPSIALVTPSYNQGRYIGATINSVLEQGYPRLHYVVQDARSTDGTADVLRAYAGRDVEICIERDNGQADAINRGFVRAKGDIMGYLNSDDLLAPDSLRRVGRFFRDNPGIDVVYGNRLVIDEAGDEIGRWILPHHDTSLIRFIDYIPQETMFWRRRSWERSGSAMDANLHFALDWDLILRFIESGATIAHDPGHFGLFRWHGEQKTNACFQSKGTKEMQTVRCRYGGEAMSRWRKTIIHSRYLLQHKNADRQYANNMNDRLPQKARSATP